MINFFTIGALLGLSAGIAPGPLLALVISETFCHDVKAGIKVALTPVITDAPVITLSLFMSASLSEFNLFLGFISLAGGTFVFYLGIENIRSQGADIEITDAPSMAFKKGILANALSPHPYLFWFTVGAPILTKAMQQNTFCVGSFISGFYVLLIGSKIMIAVISGKSKTFLTGKTYIYIMRALGVILCMFAGLLIKDGIQLMGWF